VTVGPGARVSVVVALASLGCLPRCADAPRGTASPARVERLSTGDDSPQITLTPEAERRLGIATVAVEERPLGRARSLGGEVVVAAGGRIVVSAPIAAAVLGPAAGTFPVGGQRVRRGDPLFRLLALPPERDLLGAEGEVARAEAQLQLAASRASRAEQLLRDGAGSVRQVEETRAELTAAEASVGVARARWSLLRGADLESVVDAISTLSIAAPVAGAIQTVHVAGGQAVAPGTALAEISRQHPLWIRVPVYAGDLPTFDVAQGARVVGLAEPPGADGRIATPISAPPSADPRAASVDLFFEIANTDGRYQPGQAVRVTLALRGEVRGLTVPAASLLYDAAGASWVYERTAPRGFARRRVEIEARHGDDVCIGHGLAPGAEVVVTGAAELWGTEFGQEGRGAPGVDTH